MAETIFGHMSYFPNQKLSSDKKDKDWSHRCIDASMSLIFNRQEWIRESFYNKKVNYNLANNILDEEEIHRVFNPMGLHHGEFPINIQHYNKSMSKINLLIGEEWKRPFNWKLVCTNPDASTIREEKKQQMLFDLAKSELENPNFDPQQTQQKVMDIDKYINYSYQDIREVNGTRLLNYHWWEQQMPYKFNKGFLDALLAAEEIYRTDIVAGNPIFEKCNPMSTFLLKSGESNRVEDAEIIVEVNFLPVGKVIEEFHEFLTPEQIDFLEDGAMVNSNAYTKYITNSNVFTLPEYGTKSKSNIQEVGGDLTKYFGGWFNQYREVRVIRTRWKSRLKRYKRTYIDELGFQQEDIVSEFYKADKAKGETLKEIWVNEWWEGTKIADDIYVKVGPRPYQYRNISNPAKCESGYVGTFYTINSNKAMSLMDRMRPFQYMYNLFWHKLLLGMARYDGPTEVIPFHMKPSGWSQDQWLYYKKALGMLVVDGFNEGQKGTATGLLAGQMNTVIPNVIDSNAHAGYIQQMISLIDYCDRQLAEISGVTKEREGASGNSDTLGQAEMARTQSSYITEYLFMEHENTKLRAIEAYLECCKVAYKNRGDVKLQYITDDLGVKYIEFNGEDLSEAEFGFNLINSSKILNLQQKYDMLIQTGLQTDKINFSTAMEIYNTDSMSEVRRKIEDSESRIEQQRQQEQQAQQQQNQQQIESQQQLAAQAQEYDKYKFDSQLELDKEIAMNDLDIELAKLELERESLYNDKEYSDKELELNNKNNPLDDIKGDLLRRKAQMEEDFKRKQLELNKNKVNFDKNLAQKKLEKDLEIKNKEHQLKVSKQAQELKLKASKQAEELKIKNKVATRPKPKS